MLTLTSPHDTWAHHLPASAKMAALGGWSLALFATGSPAALALANAAVLALILSCGTGFARTSALMLRPLWPFVVIVVVWHLWFNDPRGSALILLRLVATVAAANAVTMTTRLSDMVAVLTWLCRPLAHVGLRPRVLALAVALVIRFLPVMLLRMQTIRESFHARSCRRPSWRILVPALLAALDDAEMVAEALRARGGAS